MGHQHGRNGGGPAAAPRGGAEQLPQQPGKGRPPPRHERARRLTLRARRPLPGAAPLPARARLLQHQRAQRGDVPQHHQGEHLERGLRAREQLHRQGRDDAGHRGHPRGHGQGLGGEGPAAPERQALRARGGALHRRGAALSRGLRRRARARGHLPLRRRARARAPQPRRAALARRGEQPFSGLPRALPRRARPRARLLRVALPPVPRGAGAAAPAHGAGRAPAPALRGPLRGHPRPLHAAVLQHLRERALRPHGGDLRRHRGGGGEARGGPHRDGQARGAHRLGGAGAARLGGRRARGGAGGGAQVHEPLPGRLAGHAAAHVGAAGQPGARAGGEPREPRPPEQRPADAGDGCAHGHGRGGERDVAGGSRTATGPSK
mmetsp:Transcript_26696/g.83624  ORF Transcript_26696/g.83624 Transcript_26696/m.83624 type:complete len:378 (-) Transcript_26696:30-1163(-)